MAFSFGKMIIPTGMILILAASAWRVYEHPWERIELNKDEWECVKSEQRTYLQPMMIGNVFVTQSVESVICVEYKRRKGS